MSSSISPSSGMASMIPGFQTALPGTQTNIGKSPLNNDHFGG